MTAQRFELALALVRGAGQMALGASPPVSGSQSTCEADARIERWMRQTIQSAFPGDGIIGEEFGAAAGETIWVLDPIDGTDNFQRGLPTWCISVALLTRGEPRFGVVFHPPSGELFHARAGCGAFLGEQRIAASGRRCAHGALFEVGFPPGGDVAAHQAASGCVAGSGAVILSFWAGALSLAWVAAGRLDAYVDAATELWDGLAGWLLVREAAGHVNDFPAKAMRNGNAEILAAAPGLRDLATRALLLACGGARNQARGIAG